MSEELPPTGEILGSVEARMIPRLNLELRAVNLDYFLNLLNTGGSRATLRATGNPEHLAMADEMERSEKQALYLRLKAIREGVNPEKTHAELTVPLSEFEYQMVKKMGQERGGLSAIDEAEAKGNIVALDDAFAKARREAGIPGPVRRFVNRIIPNRFQR